MTPDEALFHAHLEESPFRSGLDRGRWGFPNSEPCIEWPYCILWVQADTRFAVPGTVFLRFTLKDYPAQAPNAQPWDKDRNQALANDQWPKGPGNISKVFNPGWNYTALYAPCDRSAMQGHDQWKTSLGQWWWTPDKDISLYLEFVHRCLNPRDHEK